MKKYCMWIELEYRDGRTEKNYKEFNSLEERNNYISTKNKNDINDLILYERGEVTRKKYCMWIEFERKDGRIERGYKEFNSLEERNDYIAKSKNDINDLILYEKGE